MPTTVPSRSLPVRPAPRLSSSQAVQFFWLLARSRWLHYRLEATHRRLKRAETDAAGDELLRLARRWLDTHEEIAGLLGLPAPPHVAQVRAVLTRPVERLEIGSTTGKGSSDDL